MDTSDFLRFRCANNDTPQCANCPRDFILPLNAIEGVFRSDGDRAIILIKGVHYCPAPDCRTPPRFIETNLTWDQVVDRLDGKVTNMGTVSLTYQDRIPK